MIKIRYEDWCEKGFHDTRQVFVIIMGRGSRISRKEISLRDIRATRNPAKVWHSAMYECSRALDECVLGPQLELPFLEK